MEGPAADTMVIFARLGRDSDRLSQLVPLLVQGPAKRRWAARQATPPSAGRRHLIRQLRANREPGVRGGRPLVLPMGRAGRIVHAGARPVPAQGRALALMRGRNRLSGLLVGVDD